MKISSRVIPAILSLFALGAFGLLVGSGARAEEGAAARQASVTWVYDVRVVRVDQMVSATVEVGPPWQLSGAAGATTKTPWAELLASLKARGRTTILLDQRVTAIEEREKAVFRQERKRAVLLLRNRQDSSQGKLELSDSSYVEVGTKGELGPFAGGLGYDIDARWEEGPTTDGTTPLGSATWRGSHANFPPGETLVVSHRQQQIAGTTGSEGLEIYVFVTGWPAPAK